jgi:deaminated glutathione amidase
MAAATVVAVPQQRLIAVVQMTSTSDRAANLVECEKLIQRASARGAVMIFFPECFAFIGDGRPTGKTAGRSLTSATFQAYCALAKQYKIWCSFGGFQHKMIASTSDSDTQYASDCVIDDRLRNTHVIVNSDGEIVASYSKVHLFDVELPDGKAFRESKFTQPGTELVVVDTPIGKLGLSVCYDIRFPELYAALRRAGAEVLCVPAAFTIPTGSAHWHVLLRARAIEQQCYVIAAAQFGTHPHYNPNKPGRQSYGCACVVDPWGAKIAECSNDNQLNNPSSLAFAEINRTFVSTVRKRMPIHSHRRPDLYQKWLNSAL